MIDRLDLPAKLIGFHTMPSCKIELKFFQIRGRWSAYVLTPVGELSAMERWVKKFDPVAVHIAPGVAPRVLRVEFDVLPDKLADLLNTVRVQNISLHPQGIASVLVRETPATVARFIESITEDEQEPRGIRVRETGESSHFVPKVTARQKEAISLAVAMGYYDVPHRVGLREIAKMMDMSLGALSALLRRGEASVLQSFADQALESEWEKAERQLEGEWKLRHKGIASGKKLAE